MVLTKPSSEFEVMCPMNEEPKQIPACIWKDLKTKIGCLTLDSPFIPSFVGGLLGFWLATLIFAFNYLFSVGYPSSHVYLAFCVLWVGSLIIYVLIYQKQRELIRNSRAEILRVMEDMEKKH